MKKILIPTDFSSSAENAVNYAMYLATRMKANIMLCNVVVMPAELPSAANVSAPIETFENFEHEIEQVLKECDKKFQERYMSEPASDTCHPLIEHVVGVGSVPEVIRNFSASPEVCLIVIGMSGKGGLGKFLLGSNSRSMVKVTELPLFLVREETRFLGLQKIAFATDLNKTDIAVIHALAGFGLFFNSEILIVHITEKAPNGNLNNQHKISAFLNEVTNKVNYHKIYYQHALDTAVDDGLDWLAEYGQIQLLAMVHRKHSVLHKLFKGSYTPKAQKTNNHSPVSVSS